ncbi:unnamed protein product [Rhizophagus irregularis]|nr:unnamed protein product [Rhizophagus irregularis]
MGSSQQPWNIWFSKSALKEGLEEEKELHKNVKRVMEVIVGLLKNRVDVEKEIVYPELHPEYLYLIFACINKKFFLAKVICVSNWNFSFPIAFIFAFFIYVIEQSRERID